MDAPNTSLRPSTLAAFAVVALAAAGLGYGIATWRAAPHDGAASTAAPMAAASAPEAARKVLYWYDPMKPDAKFDKPGKSPFMDMELVPRYADEGVAGGVSVDPRITQSLGVRTAAVVRESLGARFEAAGTIGFNERDVAIVQTRTAGFVERVLPRAPGDVVAAGAPLAELLVPDWAGAQQEYLALRSAGDASLAAAARQRLLLLGMPEALVKQVETSGQPQARLAIPSPITGVVQEMMVREGMSLAPGMTLARINGLGTVWLEVAVPEVQAALVAPGRVVAAELLAFPGERFEGRIAAVLPEANKETRTLRVRIELPNRGGRLKAGLVARATIAAPAASALVVPSEAVIRTGQRNLVYVAGDTPGRYTATEVQLGREDGGRIVVTKGLQEGQQVVVSGQFLIDSEASVSGALGRAGGASAAPVVHETMGTVEGIDGAEIMLQHEPVPALKWPAMSMPFTLKTPALAAGLKAGDRVRFGFSEAAGGPVVERIEKVAATAAASGASGASR